MVWLSLCLCCGDKHGHSSFTGGQMGSQREAGEGKVKDSSLDLGTGWEGGGFKSGEQTWGWGWLLQTAPLNLRVTEGGTPCCSCSRQTDHMLLPGAGHNVCAIPPNPLNSAARPVDIYQYTCLI